MSPRQLCNLAYAMLAENRDTAGLADLEELLAEPEDKERVRAKATAASMQALGGMGFGPLIPPEEST